MLSLLSPFPLPPSSLVCLLKIFVWRVPWELEKNVRTFSCHRYPLMCPFWVGSLNCLLNKTLTSSPQPCPYSILASQLYWQKCLSTHFYGGLKEIDYYCAQIKWESNATPVWLSCNWSELYTGAICNIFSKLNFFLFGFYWCMFRCPLGLPFSSGNCSMLIFTQITAIAGISIWYIITGAIKDNWVPFRWKRVHSLQFKASPFIA